MNICEDTLAVNDEFVSAKLTRNLFAVKSSLLEIQCKNISGNIDKF